MGAVVAGDMSEIGISHGTVGNFTVFPKSAEDSTLDPGGFRKNDDPNSMDGSGAPIRIMNQTLWSIEVMISNDMNTRKDIDKLIALADSPIEANLTFTYKNGVVKGGTGSIVGDIQTNTNAGTMTVKFSGGGELKDL